MSIIKALIIALSMYSKIPVPQFAWDEKGMRYALAFLPMPGIIIGALQLLLFKLSYHTEWIGTGLYAAFAAVLPIIVTGGIHMDGYCDTIDALSAYQSKERRLEILKDSNAGAFAVIWAGVYFLICYGAWTQVSTHEALCLIAFGYPASRALSGLAALFFPNANKSGSLAKFTGFAQKGFVGVMLLSVFIIVTAWQMYISAPKGICIFAGESALFIYYYHMSKRKFGGITGDLAGWFVQCAELLVLCVSVIGLG